MTASNSLLRLTSRLMSQRNALRKVLEEDVSRLREPSEVVGFGDTVDAAVDSANDEVCSRLAEIESRELAGIEQALRRIAEGRYGRCETCGGRIPAARLVALPCTTRCIECQRRDEKHSHPMATTPCAEVGTRPGRAGDRRCLRAVGLGGVESAGVHSGGTRRHEPGARHRDGLTSPSGSRPSCSCPPSASATTPTNRGARPRSRSAGHPTIEGPTR